MPSRAPHTAEPGPATGRLPARRDARAPAVGPGTQVAVDAVGRVVTDRPLSPRDVLRLQRTVGNHAVTRLLGVSSGPPGPVQRDEAWTRQADKGMDAFVTGLDKLVNGNAKAIIANPLGVPDADGYLRRWLGLVASFAGAWRDSDGDVGAALAAEPFVYTAFGYAVESLTNLSAKATLGGDLPAKHTIALQATRGHTRPDLVVKNDLGKDVGWFDITASRSETHIDRKTGSGWGTRDYVAEVTYPSLGEDDLVKICRNALAGTTSSKDLERLATLSAENRVRRAKLYAKAAGHVVLAFKTVEDESNMSKRRSKFEKTLGPLMTNDGEAGKLTPAAAKGLIAEVTPTLATGWSELGQSYAKFAALAGYKKEQARGGSSEQARELIYGLPVE